MKKMKRGLVPYLLSLLIFGMNGIIAHSIPFDSTNIVFYRTLFGSVLLILILFIRKRKLNFLQMRKQVVPLLCSGIAMGLSWLFLFEAYSRIGVGASTLAYYCGPVLVMAVSPLVFQERLHPVKLVGLCAVIFGMICVNGADVFIKGISFGLVCGLLSAVFYAAMIIFNKKITGLSGIEITLSQLVVSFLVVTLFLFSMHRLPVALSRESAIPMILLGIVNTGVACYLYFTSIQDLSAQTVSIFSYLDPLSALIFSALILHETMSLLQIAGAVLILGGMMFGELFSPRTARDDKSPLSDRKP